VLQGKKKSIVKKKTKEFNAKGNQEKAKLKGPGRPETSQPGYGGNDQRGQREGVKKCPQELVTGYCPPANNKRATKAVLGGCSPLINTVEEKKQGNSQTLELITKWGP